MERRKHPRVVVNLNAALINDRVLPIGCRVKDVSSSGMLLRHENQDGATSLQSRDKVEVRVSLKQNNERKVILLPMTIRRDEENEIAAEFPNPQPQLMKLVEPYRLDGEDYNETIINQGAAGTSTDADSTSEDSGNQTTAFTIPAAKNQLAKPLRAAPDTTGNAAEKVTHKMFYFGLGSLLAAIAIVFLNFKDNARLENRVSALESNIEQHNKTLPLAPTEASLPDLYANEIAELDNRVETLVRSVAALQVRTTQDTSRNVTASTAISREGPWVINLLTLYDETAAIRFTENARTHGVRADINQDTLRGKQVWRIQVSGFSNRDEATAYGNSSKQKLGLTSVWIFSKDR